MKINKETLLHDIADLAYVIADVSEGNEPAHTLHQTFDICEGDNLSRVNNLLSLAAMEAADAISPVAALTIKKEAFVLKGIPLPHTAVSTLPKAVMQKILEELREYLTASVLAGWLSVTLPAAAGFWQQRKAELLAVIASTAAEAARASLTFRRRLPPL